MTPELRDALVKIALPIAGIVIPLIVARLRGLDVREFFGLHKPAPKIFFAFIAGWIVWMALAEVLLKWMGVPPPGPWKPYPTIVILIRILAIGVLGPIMEELVFRGLIFGRIAPRIGVWPAILAIAVVFAVVHTNVGPATMLIIFLDAVAFGYARHRSGSVITPMVMHSLGNLFSIYQSLS